MKTKIILTLIPAIFALVILYSTPAPVHSGIASVETIVLSDPADPLYPLAEEIAQAGALPLVTGWQEALSQDPVNVIWVISPSRLSDPVLVEAGLALNKAASLPAVGILTGSTLEEARALYQRAGQPRSRLAFAANGEFPTAGIQQARIQSFDLSTVLQTQDLSRDTMAEALQQAGYLTFTGHGAARYLELDPDTHWTVKDLTTTLPPLVLSTASCQTMRPWMPDSIAMGFIHQGAAGYAGFVFSPMEGYLIGEFSDLPFRYTWPDFPVGRVMVLQNQGTMQGFAAFPYYHLIGDPRIALQAEPPYRVLSDQEEGNSRVLAFSDTPPGLIPVRVEGGGAYPYVEVSSVGAAAEDDPFFNARVQTMAIQGDRYILFKHTGGPFTIRLQARPWHYIFTRPLLDSLDHVVLFTPQNGGDILMTIPGLLALTVAGWRYGRRRGQKRLAFRSFLLISLGTGLLMAAAAAAYQALRQPHAAITTKPLAFNAGWLLGVLLVTTGATALFLTARGRTGKVVAWLLAALPSLAPAIFVTVLMAAFNLLLAAPQLGSGIYGLKMGLVAIPAAILQLLLAGLFFYGIAKRYQA